jgi:hypothetical protein
MSAAYTPGALAGATGDEKPSLERAGLSHVSRGKVGAKPKRAYRVTPEGDGDSFVIRVNGREAWALERLREAGPKGCTPIAQPAPRWSHYIFQLRGRGVPIETLHESHGGPFAGTHGRYVLRGLVTPEGGAA